MKNHDLFNLLCILLCIQISSITGRSLRQNKAPPTGYVPPAVYREVYANGRLFDISHSVRTNTPVWDCKTGLGSQFLRQVSSIKNGSSFNAAEVKMGVHTATHVDSPAHFYDNYADAGYDVTSLDLEVLNGPVLLVDVPRHSNITAEVMKSLKISKGVRRVLFRTSNTDKKLMFQKAFDSSYTAFTLDGAKWLVENTDIKLVGLDYLSVAAYVEAAPVHYEFLANRDIVLVEGLKLDDVPAGLYTLHCLPVRLSGSDGSPTRCILVK